MGIDIWFYEKRGVWCADVPQPPKGKRKRFYFGSNKEEAQVKLHQELANYYKSKKDGEFYGERKLGGNLESLLELAVEFLRDCDLNNTPQTRKFYADGLKYVTRKKDLAGRPAEKLTPDDINKIKDEMIRKGLSARTINIMVESVKRMFNWAVETEKMEDHPFGGRRLRKVSKRVNAPEEPAPKYLQIEKALDYIELCQESPPLDAIAELLLLTGMRVGEVSGLLWDNVDIRHKFIRLERHKTDRYTNKPRTVPLGSQALEILKKQIPKNNDPKPNDAVFPGRFGQPLKVSAIKGRLKRLRKKHPELKNFTFHKLRHTCATYLAKKKVPERIAQEILGHSSTLMTRYYTSIDRDDMINGADSLSDLVRDARKNNQ